MVIKLKNKYGILQIIISYCILWIPYIIQKISGNFSKDIFFISLILSVLVMIDAKMKYNTRVVKINFWIMLILLVILVIGHIL